MPRSLRILPVGGLGEVGRNMTLVAWGGDRIVVDCGVGFPEGVREPGGTEQLLPDVQAIGREPIAALLLTHGHDDHIAAVHHLIRNGAPIGRIVALPFTAGLLRAKLADQDVPVPQILIVQPGQRITTGAFDVEFVRVAHSIPDACAIALRTPAGLVLFSGDYKTDDTQQNARRRFDRKRFAALGREGVLCLLADSTNALLPGRTPSEDTTVAPLLEVVERAPGRVIVTSFASNIDRVDHAFRAADATRRRVTLLGRSMIRNTDVADRLSELRMPARPTVPPRELAGLRPRASMIVCTGSQAERYSVLARAARGEHPQLHLDGSDTVVFATRPVPGNEPEVADLQRAIHARGARIVTHDDAAIHVSGHARGDEIAELIELVRPRFLVPIHGEPDMLEGQARIAVARAGMDRGDVLLAENGDLIEVSEEGIEVVERLPVRLIEADADGRPLFAGG